jgi:nicotinamide mononucleotide adenylyltransferase
MCCDSAEIGTAYYQYKRVYYDPFSFYNRMQVIYDMLRRNEAWIGRVGMSLKSRESRHESEILGYIYTMN